MSRRDWLLPPIPPEDRTPLVDLLLALTETQQNTLTTLTERIEQLQAELARLQRRPAKPQLKPSALTRDNDDDPPSTCSARPGSVKATSPSPSG